MTLQLEIQSTIS